MMKKFDNAMVLLKQYTTDWEILSEYKERLLLFPLIDVMHQKEDQSSIRCLLSFGTGVPVETMKFLTCFFVSRPICELNNSF